MVAKHPRGMRTFVSFVSFARRPKYCRALGRILPMSDALAVQEHLWQRVGPAEALSAGMEGGGIIPGLNDLRLADRWGHDDIRAVFPSHFPWSPLQFCRVAVERIHAENRSLGLHGVALTPPPPTRIEGESASSRRGGRSGGLPSRTRGWT